MVEGIAAVATGVGLLLGFMAVGLPVFAAFLLVNLLAVAVIMGPMGYGMFVNSLYETTTTQSLVTIPLFILMGEILFRSNSVEVLLRSIDTLVGRVKGASTCCRSCWPRCSAPCRVLRWAWRPCWAARCCRV